MEYIKIVDEIMRKAYIEMRELPDDQINEFQDYLKNRILNLIDEMKNGD